MQNPLPNTISNLESSLSKLQATNQFMTSFKNVQETNLSTLSYLLDEYISEKLPLGQYFQEKLRSGDVLVNGCSQAYENNINGQDQYVISIEIGEVSLRISFLNYQDNVQYVNSDYSYTVTSKMDISTEEEAILQEYLQCQGPDVISDTMFDGEHRLMDTPEKINMPQELLLSASLMAHNLVVLLKDPETSAMPTYLVKTRVVAGEVHYYEKTLVTAPNKIVATLGAIEMLADSPNALSWCLSGAIDERKDVGYQLYKCTEVDSLSYRVLRDHGFSHDTIADLHYQSNAYCSELADIYNKEWTSANGLDWEQLKDLINACRELHPHVLIASEKLKSILDYCTENEEWDSGLCINWPKIIKSELDSYKPL